MKWISKDNQSISYGVVLNLAYYNDTPYPVLQLIHNVEFFGELVMLSDNTEFISIDGELLNTIRRPAPPAEELT